MCLYVQANLNCISIATQKEVVEIDIGGILNPPTWLDDETEYDIETIRRSVSRAKLLELF